MTPEQLAQIHRAAFVVDRAWNAQEFEDLLANPGTHLTTHDRGFALWRALAGEAELLTLAVDPTRHRQGIGAYLMAKWTASAAATCDRAFLEVAADNTGAVALYRKQGFEIIANRPKYYNRSAGAVDAWIMEARAPFGRQANHT